MDVKKSRAKKTAATKKVNRLSKKRSEWEMWAQKARGFGDGLKIIAIDPAFSCGVAFLEKGELRTSTLKDATTREVFSFLKKEITPSTVAILEGQFLGKVGTVMKIIERRVMVQTVLQLFGVLCIEVMPSEWQAEHLGKPPKKPKDAPSGYLTAWLKKESLAVAEYWQPANDDEADAGNIARWANKKIGMSPIKGEENDEKNRRTENR